jgi:hypothetical protein
MTAEALRGVAQLTADATGDLLGHGSVSQRAAHLPIIHLPQTRCTDVTLCRAT